MQIDIIIATYNRAPLLLKLLESIRRARIPDGAAIRVVVADNNSSDGTKALVERLREEWPLRLDYVFEPRQGKSFALNTAIEACHGDVIAFVDDDEEIDVEWVAVIDRVLADSAITFCSGPYLPNWGGPVPAWVPKREYPAIIGWVDAGPNVLEYGLNYSGTMMGGNAAVRASALKRLGGFNTALGRTGSNLCGCEDADVSNRLTLSGARGLYVPDMIIYHYVPSERLTKKYYRRWCHHHGLTRARVDALRRQPVAYFLGVPRYMIADAIRAIPALLAAVVTGKWNAPGTFARELGIWNLLGFVRGRLGHTPQRLAGLSPQSI